MPQTVAILPSILSADMARLGEQIEAVKRGGARAVHVDVMDGHFVPNITIGPPVIHSLRRATELLLDVHLMIEDPDRYIADFCDAGADAVTVHQEACRHLDRTIRLIRAAGAQPGIAINPATPVELLRPVLELVDCVLVMSVNPGFGGQKFIPYTLAKARELDRERKERGLEFRIEMDGGITPENLADAVRAGVNWLVAGSSVFEAPDPGQRVELMQRLAQEATLTRI